MEVGSFKCERYDCPKPKGTDCPLCGMPFVSMETASLINLFCRCRTYNVLPSEGSLMSQPNEIIECFDVINTSIEHFKAKKMEEQQSNIQKEKMLRELPHG